ncbi:hypothetical protein GCM10009578_070420 [Streptomyces rhizosphaericus]
MGGMAGFGGLSREPYEQPDEFGPVGVARHETGEGIEGGPAERWAVVGTGQKPAVLGFTMFQYRREKRGLTAEVMQQPGLGQPGFLGDQGDAGSAVAGGGEELNGGPDRLGTGFGARRLHPGSRTGGAVAGWEGHVWCSSMLRRSVAPVSGVRARPG